MVADTRLVYDGDCGFCAYTVRYAQRLTGDAVEYVPYQDVLGDYPDLSPEDFQKAIWLMTPDGPRGGRYRAAEAAYRTLALGGRPGWLWLYRKLPGFAWASEKLYTFISRHRVGAYRICRILFGKELEPARFRLLGQVLVRAVALVYLAAFWSFGVQALGLIGSEGILPVTDLVDRATEKWGDAGPWHLPMLFWFAAEDWVISAVCWFGVAIAAMVAAGYLQRIGLVALFLLYLSITHGGQLFMSYQWDHFLLEAGFLAIFATRGRAAAIWLFRWLSFRFMFMAGWVKIASGDAHWKAGTALDFHFWTQPLPNPVAWYAHHMGDRVHAWLTHGTVWIELVVPFLFFLPRHIRMSAAWLCILLEFGILLTGNYNFFNILTIVVLVSLFDDQALRGLVPTRWRDAWRPLPTGKGPTGKGPAWQAVLMGALAAVLVFDGAMQMQTRITREPLAPVARQLREALSPWRVVSSYGPFAVMTTRRDEIIVEGSMDGRTWEPYVFRHKPQALDEPPVWIIPHQPRLDWQLWFAALRQDYRQTPWFQNFAARLLRGSKPVAALMAETPFEGETPTFVRARRVGYRFTTPEERAETGHWWATEDRGLFMPPARMGSGSGGGG